ncbi:MAG: ABC transporter permease, partial [Coriobacteriia bacterium]|nr:ABC transporter permease [Coriobacteriia bacterium]
MFANTLGLIRLILRRDRIIMLLWLVGLLMLTIWFGSVVEEMYPSAMERVVAAEAMKSPAMAAIMGPVDLKDPQNVTIGELYSLYLVLWTAVIIAVMNIFHMVRHTRQEEEQGRIEIVRSLSVGRLSILASAFITALLLNMVIGLGIGVGVAALRIESMDLSSSLLMGAAMAAVGMVFAAVTAIFCQLSANSRTALSLAFGYLGFDYILRGVADVRGSELLNWFSPLGIMLRTNSFGHDHWWPILILLVLATALTIIAFWLNASRDVEAGLLPQRAGRSNATRLLSTPIGLAWRLLRGAVIIWAITIPVLGISYGTVMGDMEGFVESNEIFREIFTGDPVQFVSYIMIVITVIGTIPVLQFILKARQQENEGFAENVLVRSASRT